MPKAKFEPDVSLGELRMLTELVFQLGEGNPVPMPQAMADLGGTKDRARHARSRLEAQFGELFEVTPRGKSMVPNAAGKNLSKAYDLFQAVADAIVAWHDQEAVSAMIGELELVYRNHDRARSGLPPLS